MPETSDLFLSSKTGSPKLVHDSTLYILRIGGLDVFIVVLIVEAILPDVMVGRPLLSLMVFTRFTLFIR